METKIESFTYYGLGFPIELINVPMKKIMGEWIIDINLNELQEEAYKFLKNKHELNEDEKKFIRKYTSNNQ